MAKASLSVQAFFFGLLAAFFWGTHSVIVRYLTGDLPGLTIAVLRLYIAAFALFVILKLCSYPAKLRYSGKTFLVTTFGAVTNYIFFHLGLEHTSASNAMMLENTAPFFVLVFLVVVLRENISKVEIFATALALVGVWYTVKQDFALGGEGFDGDLLEIGAGVTWAIFVMGSSKALSQTVNTLERIHFLFNVFLASAVLLTPFVFFLPFEPTLYDVVFLLLLGIFPTAVAYYLWYEAASRVSVVSSSLLFTLSIIFTFINAYLFLGETITTDMIIGAALIVAGVLLSKFAPKKAQEAESDC